MGHFRIVNIVRLCILESAVMAFRIFNIVRACILESGLIAKETQHAVSTKKSVDESVKIWTWRNSSNIMSRSVQQFSHLYRRTRNPVPF